MRRSLLPAVCVATALCGSMLGGSAAHAQRGRWSVLDVPGYESKLALYVPREAIVEASAAVGRGAASVVFLHGAGRAPETYRSSLAEAADALGLVLLLPESTTPFGWGFDGDFALVEASLARAGSVVTLDPGKIAIAGHGEGASYAFLLAYLSDLRFSGVLALGSPFLPLSALFEPESAPPIYMLYGDRDLLYRDDAGRLREQWSNLGIDWQLEVLPGFGHSTWPQEALLEGFRFLAERSSRSAAGRCSPGRSALCLAGGRFRVEVTYSGAMGPGRGKVIGADAEGSGIFWFFDSDNWEVMVKVLDGCELNDSFWVYAAASTDVDYRLTVTDQRSGAVRVYRHEQGVASRAVTDTLAFPGCDRGPRGS